MKWFYSSFLFIVLMSCSNTDIIDAKATGDTYYHKGEDFYLKQNYDSAFVNFNKAYQEFSALENNRESAKALIFQSIIQTIKGDYFGSEESATDALKKLDDQDKTNKDLLVSIYNQIAINKEYQKDYAASINWYQLAGEKISNPYDSIVLQNNIAVSYFEAKKYDDAINILSRLHAIKYDSVIIKARVQDNLAYAKFLKDPHYHAEKELVNALQLKQEKNDLWGQNASYAHLTDYFFDKNPTEALFYAKKMLETSSKLNSADDKLVAYQKILLLETPVGSKSYFLNYQKLNDSIQVSKASAKNQFALIRYETEKQKAETAAKQNQILKQYFALSVLLLLIISGIIWYQKRKNTLVKEKEIEVRNTQLKYSKKIHDVVANGLYHVMVKIENDPKFDKESILNSVEKMYEESRDIARDDLDNIQEKDFSGVLVDMLSSYSSDLQRVIIIGNDKLKWQKVSPHIRDEVFFVLRELMINMKKHSQAKLVSVKINKNEKFLNIQYSDNGIGIKDWSKIKTSGIKNMENRIVAMFGALNFGENTSRGLIIHITIPIQ